MRKPKKLNLAPPKAGSIKQLQSEIDHLRDLHVGDCQQMTRQREEIERLRAAINGAQAEVERQRKDNEWLKRLVQNLSEAVIRRAS